MGTSTHISMAEAVPVKPDVLGERLEAYAKVLPVLKALRLCHRFGQGPDVHVTKLPKELELSIEETIIRDMQQKVSRGHFVDYFTPTWRSAFCHYEGRCQPMNHEEDSFSPLADAVSGSVEYCVKCDDYNYHDTENCINVCTEQTKDRCWTCAQKLDHNHCMNTCDANLYDAMNSLVLESDAWNPFEERDCEGWEKMIDQSKAFAKYDKVLRDHFGLEVSFSTTRIAKEDQEDVEAWPRHQSHRWHRTEELKTTICYLIMARSSAPEKKYEESDFELQGGGMSIESAQAVTIKRPITIDMQSTSKRFARALNVLDLEPYVHPSQRNAVILPRSCNRSEAGGSSVKAGDAWPQLVLFVKNTSNCDHVY